MIISTNRMRRPLRQWPFLLLPMMLIGVSAWLTIPAASSQPVFQMDNSQSASNGPPSTQSVSSTASHIQTLPVVDKQTIAVDSVSRHTMLIQVRGLGVLVPGDNRRLKAVVQIATPQAKDIRIDQPASIDTGNGIVSAAVTNVSSDRSNGSVEVDLSLKGALPQGTRADMNVDSVIEIDRLNDVLAIPRPTNGQAGGVSSLFKVDEGGATATRVRVKFGKSSIDMIEILEGLEVGDKVIISDMSRYEGVNTIKLK